MNKGDLIREMFSLVKKHEEGDVKTFERMDEILDAGITIDECIEGNSAKEPIMSFALYQEKNDIVYYFLENGGDALQSDVYGSNFLHNVTFKYIAIKTDFYFKLFKDTVEKSKKPLDLIRSASGCGLTPLHILMDSESVDVIDSIKYCVEKGADINALDSEGDTPLDCIIKEIMFSLSSGDSIDAELVSFLLEDEATMEMKDGDGNSFATAIHKRQEEIEDKKVLTELIKLIALIDYKKTNRIETKTNNIHKNKIKKHMQSRPKIGGLKR